MVVLAEAANAAGQMFGALLFIGAVPVAILIAIRNRRRGPQSADIWQQQATQTGFGAPGTPSYGLPSPSYTPQTAPPLLSNPAEPAVAPGVQPELGHADTAFTPGWRPPVPGQSWVAVASAPPVHGRRRPLARKGTWIGLLCTICAVLGITIVTFVVSRPTDWTMAEAQQKYLAMVAPGNAILDQSQRYQGKDLAVYRDIGTNLMSADDDLVRQMRAGKWPKSVKPAVAAFTADVLAMREVWRSMSNAQTTSELNSVYYESQPLGIKQTQGSLAVRQALGLPAG